MGYEDFEIADPSASGGSGTGDGDLSAECPMPPKGSSVEMLPALRSLQAGGSECFLMDEREVTQAEYETFLADSPKNAAGTPCDWNDSFVDEGCTPSTDGTGDEAAHPQACVDWCDASAYCASVDKVLCRGSYTAPNLATKDDFYASCSNDGASVLPFSGGNADAVCTSGADTTGTSEVGKQTACVSDAGHLDLLGNVAEWTGACDGASDGDDSCLVRGGSFGEISPTCETSRAPSRSTTAPDIGFRCCAY
jgi:formylglycine-generating enzyme required for sulfatase activity